METLAPSVPFVPISPALAPFHSYHDMLPVAQRIPSVTLDRVARLLVEQSGPERPRPRPRAAPALTT